MNRRQEVVTYRPFQTQPVLQQGLLPIERYDGDLERRVAAGLARIADTFAARAEQEAQFQGERDGQAAAMSGAPQPATINGGDVTGTASINGQAGHIVGAQAAQQKGIRVTVARPEIQSLIDKAAAAHGVDREALTEVARIESGFNPSAANPNSSAAGLFQFIDGTARQYGLRDKLDPAQSADAGARLMADNAAYLKKQLGRDATPGELYLAHQQGMAGAAKLLSNPDARAVDIVGADAVKLNGGDAEMTAAQFAALWTSKVHAGNNRSVVSVLPEHRDGKVSVTAVRTPLEIIPGKAGTFRPTGRNTIYGRAYDVAGTKTWLQMAKMTIVQEQAEIYDKYKDDPAQLEAAYGRLLADHKREGVYFPEVAPEYELSFKSNAFGLVQQARQEQAKKQEQVDRVDFIDRISGLEDRKSQMMAGIDPRDPQSSSLLADMQGTIDSHYDSAVSRGILSPGEASKAKSESKSAMVVPYYLKQAEGLKADEIDVLHGRMKADYAAGTLAGVTARDWADIEQGLSSAVGTRRTNDDKADKDLMARGNDVFHRLLRGEPVAPSDLARMRTDALTAPHGDDIIASTDARMRLATALRTQPIDAVEGKLDAILKGDRAKASVEDVEFARTQIAEVRKNLTVDPLGVAESFGIIPATPPIALDGLKDPAALRDALAYRRGAALAAANHFGVPVRYFRPGEAAQVVSQAMANPDAMVAFTLNVTQSFGKDTPAAMREISEDGPVMAHAVGLSVSTGDASLARDVAAISLMKARKDYSVKMPEAGRLETRGSTFLAGALASQPQMQHAALATANLLFEKMAAEQGFDPADIKTDGSVADLAYRRALDRALGGQKIAGIDTGGLGLVNDLQIIVPPLMAKERPDELLGGLTAKQLERLSPLGSINGVPVSASQIRDGYLVSVGDGLYRVTTNDPQGDDPAYLIAPDGKPWLLDIRQLDRINRDTKPEFRPVYRSNPGYQ